MDEQGRQALAPAGALRMGLYAGSPTSFVADAGTGEAKGVGHDLGLALARHLGIAFEPVVFKRPAEVLEAAKAGRIDLAFTNATPARAKDLDFTPTVLAIELGYLVPAGSPIADATAVDAPGVRVGVSAGSTSEGVLARELRQARLVAVVSLEAAGQWLARGELDAFATNKAILHEMADGLAGSRVLAGRWGLESLALGIPKGREAGLAVLLEFAAAAAAEGLVERAVARSGLRGTATPS